MVFGLAVGVFLIFYLTYGAGLEDYGFGFLAPMVSSGSILMGFVHVIGFVIISLVSFAMGIRLCAGGGGRAENRRRQRG